MMSHFRRLAAVVSVFGPSRLSARITVVKGGGVPVRNLGLFQPVGRIHEHPILSRPVRVFTLDAARACVLERVKTASPDMALRLSPGAPDWIDVLLDGKVVLQMPTRILRAR